MVNDRKDFPRFIHSLSFFGLTPSASTSSALETNHVRTLPLPRKQVPALSCSGWRPGPPASRSPSRCRRSAISSCLPPCSPEQHWFLPANTEQPYKLPGGSSIPGLILRLLPQNWVQRKPTALTRLSVRDLTTARLQDLPQPQSPYREVVWKVKWGYMCNTHHFPTWHIQGTQQIWGNFMTGCSIGIYWHVLKARSAHCQGMNSGLRVKKTAVQGQT